MVPFDFDYYKPSTLQEAVQLYSEMSEQEKRVIYYSGGTEIITFARLNQLRTDVVIDIKGIADCHTMKRQGDHIVIGAAVSLNKVTESGLFPLLGEKVRFIADHTSRNKITIGGNISSRLIYREAVLPLLLADVQVKVAGRDGERIVSIHEIFQQEIKLEPEQFLVQFIIDQHITTLPFVSMKKTRRSSVGYPLVSIAAVVKNNEIHTALSGVCEYPFLSAELNSVLNDTSLAMEDRVAQSLNVLPGATIDDTEASAAYREFVLSRVLFDTLQILGG